MYISLVLHSVLCSFIVPKEQSVVRLCSVYMTFILKKSCGGIAQNWTFRAKSIHPIQYFSIFVAELVRNPWSTDED